MPREFPTAVAAQVTKASIRQLDTWARTGLLPPSGKPADGKGSRRSYTFQDLVSIRTIVDLRERKCPLQQIRASVSELRRLNQNSSNSQTLARLTLLTDGKRVYILTDDAQVMDVLAQQHVWAVPLGRHIQETVERIEQLPQTWTEIVSIRGRPYHLQISREDCAGQQEFTAHCRELPGTLESAASPEQAVERLKLAVERVLTVLARVRGATGTVGRRRGVVR